MLNNKNSVLEYAWSAVFLTLQLSISLSENAAIMTFNNPSDTSIKLTSFY